MLHETRVLLSLIYRDYICKAEERKQLLQNDVDEIKREEEYLKEKYNVDNIFKERDNYGIKTEEIEEKQITIRKESIIKRIFNKIRKILHI